MYLSTKRAKLNKVGTNLNYLCEVAQFAGKANRKRGLTTDRFATTTNSDDDFYHPAMSPRDEFVKVDVSIDCPNDHILK